MQSSLPLTYITQGAALYRNFLYAAATKNVGWLDFPSSGRCNIFGMAKSFYGITNSPEFNIVVFSFLLHFIWEFIQAPTYAGMIDLNHWDGIKLCTSATFGDVGFALTAFWITSAIARSRSWILNPSSQQILVFLFIGIALTISFEYYYTQHSLRWTYSELMPLVPPFGTGLSPLLQWLIIPILVIWFSQRQINFEK